MALDGKLQTPTLGFSAKGGPVKVCFGSEASPTILTWGTSTSNTYSGPFNTGSGGVFVLNAATADNTIEFMNPLSLGTAAKTIQVNANVATISGVLGSGSNGGPTKTGNGTLVLSNTNTYIGPTTITAGVLRATQGTGLPNTSYLKLNGGVYETSGTFTRVNSTTVNGANFNWSANNGGFSANGGKLTVTINDDAATEQVWVTANTNNGIRGILKFGSSTANAETEFQNNLDLTGGGRAMDVAAGTGGDFATISGVIRDSAGTGSLTKIGAGKLVLNNTNTYVGSTIISAGTLALGTADSIASSSSINLAAAAVLDTTAQASFAIPAAQPVTLHLSGTGTGSCARIMAGALDITNANVTLTVDSTLDDPVYVLADYTTLDGSVFLSVTDPLPDGYTLNYTHNGGTQIALVSSGVSGYSMWATANAGDEAANLDYDKDGVANGVEYFMGENGSTFTANPTVVGGKVTWPYDATTSGITYQVMSSTDLSSWVPVSPQPVPSGGTLEYTLPTGTPKLFVRLEVVTTP
jgi:autotransporter-associated beta strand protein